jgi:hypothetical protein
MAQNVNLKVAGLAPEDVYTTLVSKGVSASEASSFVGEWLLTNVGQGVRTFDYKQAFPDSEPDCAPKFQRSFAHADWVDGESVVQAQQTTGEAGFNARFHRIEADLDGLNADNARLFACVAEMRLQLRALLDEIKTELNRIDSDLGRNAVKPPIVSASPATFATGSFLGTTKVGTQTMTMWQTSAGMMMLPAVTAVNPDPTSNTRVQGVGNLAKFIADTPGVATTFGTAGFTKADFVTKFGTQPLADGTTVADQLSILPPDAKYTTVDAMLTDLSDRQAAALRSSVGADAVITSALGLKSGTTSLAAAPVDALTDTPQAVRDALTKNGITTLGQVSDAGAGKIATILKQENVPGVSAGDVAALASRARTLTKVG